MSKAPDPLVLAFRALADSQGGVRVIASKIKSNWQSLDQIYKGVMLPSGNPRGIGPQLREKLTQHYPEWLSIDGLRAGVESAEAEPSNVADGPKAHGPYPVISEVQAGDWTEICDQFQPGEADDWRISAHNLGKCGYMLRVKGKSMYAPGERYSFDEGMLLHVRPEVDPMPGQFVVVRREESSTATFKRYMLIEGMPYLVAINPDWPKELKYLPLKKGDIWCGVVVAASLPDLP